MRRVNHLRNTRNLFMLSGYHASTDQACWIRAKGCSTGCRGSVIAAARVKNEITHLQVRLGDIRQQDAVVAIELYQRVHAGLRDRAAVEPGMEGIDIAWSEREIRQKIDLVLPGREIGDYVVAHVFGEHELVGACPAP